MYRYPEKLAAFLAGTLADYEIPALCEALGAQPDTALALAVLMPLLGHGKAFVREAAVLGLRQHIESDEVQGALRAALRTENTPEVRSALTCALRMA